jgi:hypothetical protein
VIGDLFIQSTLLIEQSINLLEDFADRHHCHVLLVVWTELPPTASNFKGSIDCFYTKVLDSWVDWVMGQLIVITPEYLTVG